MFVNIPTSRSPPRFALRVHVGLGKSSAARRWIASLIESNVLRSRKVIYAVPRHDLAEEQRQAFLAMGIAAMVWKGRTASDPSPDNPDRQMCHDPQAPLDAMAVERAIEQAVCKVRRDNVTRTCPYYSACGYQAQKLLARHARVILAAHDSLFHEASRAIGDVGLLVLDEGFWAAGLRGVEEDIDLTLDGLRPAATLVHCYDHLNKPHWSNTADLADARERLWKVLDAAPRGPLSIESLRLSGLTPEQCRRAAGLERRRLRNPFLVPGMDADTRRSRISSVLPQTAEPWAPPGRAAAMWRLIALGLEKGDDVAGAVVFDADTDNGSVRSLSLRWRSEINADWGGDGPILLLDATMRIELVERYIHGVSVAEPLTATEPYVTVTQILDAPTSAKALTPNKGVAARHHTTAVNNLRDLTTFIALRAAELHGKGAGGQDILVIGQDAAIAALQYRGLPRNVVGAHFNALSGLDRWRGVAGLIVIGRTLPVPVAVEDLAMALSNEPVVTSRSRKDWWYRSVERRIGLADGKVHTISGEEHEDALAEAVRWSVCEGELIQAIGRGRGVNRTATNPLHVDLLTDVVLPITVNEVLLWKDIQPIRRDAMAAAGVVLENTADMARAFPELWPNHDAARQDAARSVTFCYYRILYNSRMSHSSLELTYRPVGAGQKDRTARFDLALIPDPRAWLERRLGPLAYFEIIATATPADAAAACSDMTRGPARSATTTEGDPHADLAGARERLTALNARFDATIVRRNANDRVVLTTLSLHLERADPRTKAA